MLPTSRPRQCCRGCGQLKQFAEQAGGGADPGEKALDLHVFVRRVVTLIGIAVGHEERRKSERFRPNRIWKTSPQRGEIDRRLSETATDRPVDRFREWVVQWGRGGLHRALVDDFDAG